MKSELLRKAMMAKYQDGGKVKKEAPKKNQDGAKPILVKSTSEIPKDAVLEKDPVTGQEYWVKKTKGDIPGKDPSYKPKTPPTPYTPKPGAKKGTGGGSPKPGTPPKETPKKDPDVMETEQRWVVEPSVEKPITPQMTFGFKGRLNEYFEDPTYVNVDGKPTLIHKYSIPAQYDEKTGTFDSNTGSMNPTKVAGYYDSKGNFIGVDPFSLGEAKFTFDKDKKMVYDPSTIKPSPYGANAAKLRREGAIIGNDSNQYAKIQQANEALAKKGLGEVKVNEVIEPVNTLFGGLGINKHKPVEVKKDEIAPTKGINMSLDTPPVVAPNMEELKVKFNSGGLVKKYYTGRPIVNPNVKYGDSKLYTQQANKGLNKFLTQPNGGGLKLDDSMSTGSAGLSDTASDGKDFSKFTTPQAGGAYNAIGQIGGSAIDAADRKDGRSSIAGQAAAGAVKGAGQGAQIGGMLGMPVAGAIVGGSIGLVAGGMKGKKEKQERIDATTEDIRNNVVAQQYSDSKDTYKSDLYNEKDYRKGLKGLFAKGGTIKGKGTGTSDSIETKMGKQGIEENSFIVPAKNNGLAKLIRRDVLGDSPNKEAKFKKGGNADMAVSNGEHLFTPAEKKKITAYLGQEILEKLAPEAEENEDKKYGGLIGKYGNGGNIGNNKMQLSNKEVIEKAKSMEDRKDINVNLYSDSDIARIQKMYDFLLGKPKSQTGAYVNTGDVLRYKINSDGKGNVTTSKKTSRLGFLDDPILGEVKSTIDTTGLAAGNKNKFVENIVKTNLGRQAALMGDSYVKETKELSREDVLTRMQKIKDDIERNKVANSFGDERVLYRDGGNVSTSKAKQILKGGTAHGNPLTDAQKGYFGVVAGGNAYKDGGNVAKGTTITVGNEQATWNGTNWVDKTGNKYSASYAKKFEDVISSNQQKEQQRLANQQASKYNTYKRKLAEAKADTKYDHSVDIANYQKFIDEYEGKALPKVETKATPKTGVQKIVPTTAQVVPASNKAGVTKPTKKGLAKVVEQSGFEPMTPKEVTLPVAKGSDLSQFDPNSVTVEDKTGYDPKTGMFKSTVSETGTYGLPQSTENSKYGLADAIGMGAATLQAGYGLSQLMKDKRPVDRLDPAFSQLTDEAIAASKYGYSPAQRALLNQQITQGRIGQQAQINQLAGGNAAVGLANARAAINSEMNKRLQMASEDERLRMQKAQYAAGLAGTRAQMSRQLFADKMNEFQQKQAAGAELLGSGLSNLIQSARIPAERKHQEDLTKLIYGR